LLPDNPSIHSELPWSVDALILDALRDRLAADPPLRGVFGDMGFVVVERRAVLALESLSPPIMALALFADREGRGTSSYGAEQETVIEISILTPPPTRLEDHSEHLRSRIVARTRVVIRQRGGALYTSDGRQLATAQTVIDRVNFDQAALPSQLVLTIVRITFRTDISLLSQEVIE
jgi:hypothetical protein